mgnify:CR=1 FL=1
MGDLLKTSTTTKLFIVLALTALCAGAGFYIAGKITRSTPRVSGVEHVSAPYAISAEDRLFYKLLDEKAATGTAAEVGELVLKNINENPRRIAVALDWARDNSVRQNDPDKINSLYYLLYADLEYFAAQAFLEQKMTARFIDMSKTALAALLTAEALLATDIARCEDQSARSILIPLMAPRMETLHYAYGLFDEQQMRDLSVIILSGVSSMWNRAPNKEVCASGRDSVIKALEEGATTVKAPKRKGDLSETTILIPPKDFTVEPKFIDHNTWMEKTAAIHQNLVQSWAQRYQDYIAVRDMRRAARAQQQKENNK